MMIFMLLQKCHLLYIHLHSWELRKLPLQSIFFYGKIDFKLFGEMLHFKEKDEFWYLTAVQSVELCRIKNLQMLDLFKVGGIFQCFFPKNKVAKFHFLKPP